MNLTLTIVVNALSKYRFVQLPVVFLMLFLSFKSSAQTTTVSGTVTGENSTPLSAVSVTVKGTSKGTSTNNLGQFTISASPDATLVFSSVGYQNKEINVAGQTNISVTLAASALQLDQVVVVGYGTQRKRDLTGSVASIK